MAFVDLPARLISPSSLPRSGILSASFVAILAIFAFDLAYGSTIWLHELYIFPLSLLAYYCKPIAAMAIGVVLTTIALMLTLSSYDLSTVDTFVNCLIALTANLTVAGIARAGRVRVLQIEAAVGIDPLTGLYNRRGFETIAEREIARERRYGGALSLAMLDLDHFKELNDSRGHDAGDRALSLLGNILRAHTRRADALGRLGGDEFVILMPSTPEADCATACEALSASIAQLMAESGLPVTASIGHVTFREPPESLALALRRVDEAMYAAKAVRGQRTLREGRGTELADRHPSPAPFPRARGPF
jgi:diguanylate cyclase (GGDEF)-like protein